MFIFNASKSINKYSNPRGSSLLAKMLETNKIEVTTLPTMTCENEWTMHLQVNSRLFLTIEDYNV